VGNDDLGNCTQFVLPRHIGHIAMIDGPADLFYMIEGGDKLATADSSMYVVADTHSILYLEYQQDVRHSLFSPTRK
jgi:hypothetical protein